MSETSGGLLATAPGTWGRSLLEAQQLDPDLREPSFTPGAYRDARRRPLV